MYTTLASCHGLTSLRENAWRRWRRRMCIHVHERVSVRVIVYVCELPQE